MSFYNYIEDDSTDGFKCANDTDDNYLMLSPEGTTIACGNWNILYEKQYDQYPYDYRYFNEGLAIFRKNDLYGYCNEDGEVVIEANFIRAAGFNNGKALVKYKSQDSALIDSQGNILINFGPIETIAYNHGLISFKGKNEKVGFMDEQGNIVNEPCFDGGDVFINDYAVVSSESGTGVINRQGDFVIKPVYDLIHHLDEDRFAIGKPYDENRFCYLYALVTADGQFLTDFILTDIYPFVDGLASVCSDLTTYLIDTEGNKSSNLPVLTGIGSIELSKGLYKVEVDNSLIYYDKTGKIIWQSSSEIKLNGYSVIEKKLRMEKYIAAYYPEIKGLENVEVENKINDKLRDLFLTDEKLYNEDLYGKIEYNKFYRIAYSKNDLLVLLLLESEYYFGAMHPVPYQYTIALNLKIGQRYELKDLFKPDGNYVERLSNIIKTTMARRPGKYFDNQFKKINKNQHFVIKEDYLQLYFQHYEVASYAMGFPFFNIMYSDISDIINKDGSLWQSLE